MAFLVRDTQSDRHETIRRFVHEGEPVIAVLLAAADFEWTVRRAILSLGRSPRPTIHALLGKCSGLDAYKDAWRDEVTPSHQKRLPALVLSWDDFRAAFDLRNKLIHGVQGTTGRAFAERRVERILAASAAIATFTSEHGFSVFSRLPARRRSTAHG